MKTVHVYLKRARWNCVSSALKFYRVPLSRRQISKLSYHKARSFRSVWRGSVHSPFELLLQPVKVELRLAFSGTFEVPQHSIAFPSYVWWFIKPAHSLTIDWLVVSNMFDVP